MDTFAPEFNAYWRAETAGADRSVETPSADVALDASQQVALEELAERVSAARSVV